VLILPNARIGFQSQSEQKNASSPDTTRPALRPTKILLEWDQTSLLWVRRPENDGDSSLQSRIKVEAEWNYTSASSLCLYGRYRKFHLLLCDGVSGNMPINRITLILEMLQENSTTCRANLKRLSWTALIIFSISCKFLFTDLLRVQKYFLVLCFTKSSAHDRLQCGRSIFTPIRQLGKLTVLYISAFKLLYSRGDGQYYEGMFAMDENKV
jgi:hypothetical protein